MPFTGTTEAQAISNIQSNPGLTTNELLGIFDRMSSASASTVKIKVAYTGEIRLPDGSKLKAFNLVDKLKEKYDSPTQVAIGTVNDTEAGKLLSKLYLPIGFATLFLAR